MSWLEDTDTSTETKVVEINWLKIPSPETIGKTTEVRVRVLDGEAVGTWRHWLKNRPYNCPGFEICPVCKVRQTASKTNPDYKNEYRLDYKYFMNVLHEHEVKMWSFSPTVGRKLKVFETKYGDLSNYDISVSKRKTGPLDQNIEYDVIFEKEYALTDEDTAISETKIDRSQFVKPAELEVLKKVALGQDPNEDQTGSSLSNKATKADMITLKALVEANKFHLGDFGIVETSPPPREVVLQLIESLKQEK